jgi:23S rRNA (cytidine1920-2'-O)/16S rRNA (cytidine1409-2'-O)-methyltransferase
MAVEKERLDIILVEKGFFPTREKAKQNIMAGLVFVDNKRVDKAGEMIKYSSPIEFHMLVEEV